MSIISKTAMVALAVFMFASSVLAGDSTSVHASLADVDPANAQAKALKTQALALKRLEFELFAKAKIKQLNQNHIFSPSRMEITRQPNGTYRARYHQIDDASMDVKVSRSQSGALPYVGVLFYREQVFEATASTPAQLDPDQFSVVQIIPNRHIFSYQKGAWR